MIFLRLLGAMIVTDYLLMETILRRTSPDSRFNPHAPHVGSDIPSVSHICVTTWFQSTLPTWGATAALASAYRLIKFQSTLPTWGATQQKGISKSNHCFNPRSPRGERRLLSKMRKLFGVSIHAPHVGSDSLRWLFLLNSLCFNPRSPRGERR